MAKISIIIPVYNGEKYIDDCLRSVMEQKISDIEIICVDDGSTDNTLNLLNKYSRSDNRIKIISKKNSGYGNSMNVGIQHATGEYIGIVEADDTVPTDMFSTLYDIAVSNNVEVVKANYYWLIDDDGSEHLYPKKILSENMQALYGLKLNYNINTEYFQSGVVSWAGIYKSELIINNRIRHNETPGASFQDNGFFMQVMIHAKSVLFIQDYLYHLRRDNKDSSIFSKDKIDVVRKEYDFILERIKEYGRDLDILMPVYWRKRFNACMADIWRVAYDAKIEALKRVADDMRSAVDEGMVIKEHFDKAEWDRLNQVVKDPTAYFKENFWINDETKGLLKNAAHIAVFGATGKAERTLSLIRSLGLGEKVQGVYVSDLRNNTDVVNYIPVHKLCPEICPKDTLFVVSTSKKYYSEISDLLRTYGYNNYIHVDEMK